jgi:hypothetical protein
MVGIREVIRHCVQAKVVEKRKRKGWTSVKEMVGRKVVEEDAAVSIIGPRMKAGVNLWFSA